MDGFLTGCGIYGSMLNGLDIVGQANGILANVSIPANAKYVMIASVGGVTPPFPVILSTQIIGGTEVGVATSNGYVTTTVSITDSSVEVNSGRISVIFFG